MQRNIYFLTYHSFTISMSIESNTDIVKNEELENLEEQKKIKELKEPEELEELDEEKNIDDLDFDPCDHYNFNPYANLI